MQNRIEGSHGVVTECENAHGLIHYCSHLLQQLQYVHTNTGTNNIDEDRKHKHNTVQKLFSDK